MAFLDLMVLAVLAVMAAWPWVAQLIAPLASPRPAIPATNPAAQSSTEEWRQAWASTLISLIDDIEGGEGHFEDAKSALKLAKELLWEVIGGDGPTPSKAK